jgi:UDP-N-acetylglucosamine transferase subunit ALG13
LILVTVGNHTQPFQRLVDWMDALAGEGGEPVIIQAGGAGRPPRHAQWFSETDAARMEALLRQARWVVAHAGAGSILSAQQAGARLVVVPRRKALGEHIDDHQVELAEALAARGKVLRADSAEELRRILSTDPRKPSPAGEGPLVEALRRRVAEVAAMVGR